ncbi:MAG: hypothetical protein AB1646_00120 [Thermodesulfobacteriota bacterium]
MHPGERVTICEPRTVRNCRPRDTCSAPDFFPTFVDAETGPDRHIAEAPPSGGISMADEGHSPLSFACVTDAHALARYRPGRSELRDAGLASAVNRIIRGIEKHLSNQCAGNFCRSENCPA